MIWPVVKVFPGSLSLFVGWLAPAKLQSTVLWRPKLLFTESGCLCRSQTGICKGRCPNIVGRVQSATLDCGRRTRFIHHLRERKRNRYQSLAWTVGSSSRARRQGQVLMTWKRKSGEHDRRSKITFVRSFPVGRRCVLEAVGFSCY